MHEVLIGRTLGLLFLQTSSLTFVRSWKLHRSNNLIEGLHNLPEISQMSQLLGVAHNRSHEKQYNTAVLPLVDSPTLCWEYTTKPKVPNVRLGAHRVRPLHPLCTVAAGDYAVCQDALAVFIFNPHTLNGAPRLAACHISYHYESLMLLIQDCFFMHRARFVMNHNARLHKLSVTKAKDTSHFDRPARDTPENTSFSMLTVLRHDLHAVHSAILKTSGMLPGGHDGTDAKVFVKLKFFDAFRCKT